jgi:hypothetical protein
MAAMELENRIAMTSLAMSDRLTKPIDTNQRLGRESSESVAN